MDRYYLKFNDNVCKAFSIPQGWSTTQVYSNRFFSYADVVILSDGKSFKYLKNRADGNYSKKVEEDMTFVILSSNEL